MGSYKIVQTPQFFLPSKWQEINSSKKNTLVNSEGLPINPTYEGSRYRVLCEAQHNSCEYLKRLALGIAALFFTLGIAYCFSHQIKSLLIRKKKIFICRMEKVEQQSNSKIKNLQNVPLINGIAPQKILDLDIPKKEEKPLVDVPVNDLPFQYVEEIITKQNAVNDQENEKLLDVILDEKPMEKIHLETRENNIEPKEITIEDASNLLKQGVELKPNTIERIKDLLPNIQNLQPDEGVKIINDDFEFFKFSIPEEPHLNFTVSRAQDPELFFESQLKIQRCFNLNIRAKKLMMIHHLDHLHMPKSKLFKIEREGLKYALMAEEALDFETNNYAEEDLYYTKAAQLKPVVKQLAKFIFEFGDDNVGVEKYKILKSNDPQNDKIQCSIINLRSFKKDPIKGFLGQKDKSLDGLLGRMPNEELIDTVIEEAKNLGLQLTKLMEPNSKFRNYINLDQILGIPLKWGKYELNTPLLKVYQLKKIENYHAYKKFHADKGIIHGNEICIPIEAIDELGLNLEREENYAEQDPITGKMHLKDCKLRSVVIDVVNYINESIRNSKKPYVKEKRQVFLSVNHSPFSHYYELDSFWLTNILDALLQKKYIFNFSIKDDQKNRIFGYIIEC